MPEGPHQRSGPQNRLNLIELDQPIELGIYVILQDLADKRVTQRELGEIVEVFPPAAYFVKHFNGLTPEYCKVIVKGVGDNFDDFKAGNLFAAIIEDADVQKGLVKMEQRQLLERRREKLFADLKNPTGEDALERIVYEVISGLAEGVVEQMDLKDYVGTFPPLFALIHPQFQLEKLEMMVVSYDSPAALRRSYIFKFMMSYKPVTRNFLELEKNGIRHLPELWRKYLAQAEQESSIQKKELADLGETLRAPATLTNGIFTILMAISKRVVRADQMENYITIFPPAIYFVRHAAQLNSEACLKLIRQIGVDPGGVRALPIYSSIINDEVVQAYMSEALEAGGEFTWWPPPELEQARSAGLARRALGKILKGLGRFMGEVAIDDVKGPH